MQSQTWKDEIIAAIEDFKNGLGKNAVLDGWRMEFLPAPHRPGPLPSGHQALYAFWGLGGWLKIGIVGPNSSPRFHSQHYNAGSARSTLAASLIGDPRVRTVGGFSPNACGDWIRANVHRCNVLIPASQPSYVVKLLETYLHQRLAPRYEGGRRNQASA